MPARRFSDDAAAEPQRISKLLAARGICSRREAERLIAAGQVLLEGEVVREQGVKAPPEARLEIAGRGQQWLDDRLTLALHKPIGVVSTQPEGGQIPAWKLLNAANAFGSVEAGVMARVLEHPYYFNVAGRLDKDSRGLLIMTQDGPLAAKLTGGRLVKKYLVSLDREASPEQLRQLGGRMSLDGQALLPMLVQRAGARRLRFELRQGRKHQIRRTCEQVGLRVVDLLRTDIGGLALGELPVNAWRVLSQAECVALLKPAAKATAKPAAKPADRPRRADSGPAARPSAAKRKR